VGLKCPECGFLYVESSPSDRQLHSREHDKIVNGLRLLSLRKCKVVWAQDSRAVVVINCESPRYQKLLAQKVSIVAAGEVGYSGVAYAASEPPDKRRIHLFLGVSADRALAYLCFECRYQVWQCSWQEYDNGMTHLLDDRWMWSIGYVWVSKGNRRKGWLRDLLSAASDHLGFRNDFGWYTPFSEMGEAAARRLCPKGIFIAK
jgi:hypothetical protein